MTYNVAFVLYPRFEELDFAGPWEVFAAASRSVARDWQVYTVSETPMVTASHGLTVRADYSFGDSPTPNLLVVPGGDAIHALESPALETYVQSAGSRAERVASVCTGAFILHRAGLLQGRRATTHWGAVEYLRKLDGVTFEDHRWVEDGNIVTAAGVSAGIDMALYLLGQLVSPQAARQVQRYLQYEPDPPYQDQAE